MRLGIFRFLLLAPGLGVASAVTAHHPPLMERCASFSFAGRVDRIEWRNPHVELFIRTDDGASYRLAWLNIYQLGRIGIERDTLRVDDPVSVTAGTRPDDILDRPLLLSRIHRTSDGWEWSQEPQGC